MDKAHFLYSCDEKYFPCLRISIASLLRFNSYPSVIHIFTMDSEESNQKPITGEQIKELNRIGAALNLNTEIKVYDVTKEYCEILGGSANKDSEFTPYASLRLLAPRILDCGVVTYLDADTIICDDISDIFDSLEEDRYDLAAPVMDNSSNYVVSLCLVFNVEKMKMDKGWFTVLDKYNSNLYEYPDQDALNYSGLKIKGLPGCYACCVYEDHYTKVFHLSSLFRFFTGHGNFFEVDPLVLFNDNRDYIKYLRIISEYDSFEFIKISQGGAPIKTRIK